MKTNFDKAVFNSGLKGVDIASKAGVTPEAVSILRKKGIKKLKTAEKYGKILKTKAFFLLG